MVELYKFTIIAISIVALVCIGFTIEKIEDLAHWSFDFLLIDNIQQSVFAIVLLLSSMFLC